MCLQNKSSTWPVTRRDRISSRRSHSSLSIITTKCCSSTRFAPSTSETTSSSRSVCPRCLTQVDCSDVVTSCFAGGHRTSGEYASTRRSRHWRIATAQVGASSRSGTRFCASRLRDWPLALLRTQASIALQIWDWPLVPHPRSVLPSQLSSNHFYPRVANHFWISELNWVSFRPLNNRTIYVIFFSYVYHICWFLSQILKRCCCELS